MVGLTANEDTGEIQTMLMKRFTLVATVLRSPASPHQALIAQAKLGVLQVSAENYAAVLAECSSKGDERSISGNDVFEIRISTLKDGSILDYLPRQWKAAPDVNETHFRTEVKIFPYQRSLYTRCSRRQARRRWRDAGDTR